MKRFGLIFFTALLAATLLLAEIYVVKAGSQYESKISVYFAKDDIPAKTLVSEDMLLKKEINIGFFHKQSVTDPASIVGLKAKFDIVEGEMLLSHKFTNKDDMEIIDVENKDCRLFALDLKGDQANGWWLFVGQLVDVIFVPSSGSQVERLNDIRVAALISQEGTLLQNGDRHSLPRYVCLELTKEQDEMLAFAKGNGRIELSAVPVVE